MYLIALGANLPSALGTPDATLRAALARLAPAGLEVAAVSRFFRSPAHPPGAGPDYVNAAAVARGRLPPADALAALHRIESDLGRRRAERWGPRVLDLDLLADDDAILPDAATLAQWMALPPGRQAREAPGVPVLPHPRMHERAFVLVPLAEVAPEWRHPLSGQSVAAMLASLPEQERRLVTPL